MLGALGAGAGWLGNALSRMTGQGGGNPVSGAWTFDARSNRINLFISGTILGQPWTQQLNCVFEQTTPEGILVGYDEKMVEVRVQRLRD